MALLAQSAAIVLLPLLLAACGTTKQAANVDLESVPGLEARMRGVGSAAIGLVRVVGRADGFTLTLNFGNLPPGSYRLAFHDKGNCSSPNLYSAGPAWAPPGSQKPGQELIPGFAVGSDGDVVFTTYIRGVQADGKNDLRGRTVVLHAGDTIGAAVPGQRNNRVACGVLDSIKPIF